MALFLTSGTDSSSSSAARARPLSVALFRSGARRPRQEPTDQLALGALRGARELGPELRADLSVVGFDDIPETARSRRPLTTVRQPLVGKGMLAGERLFALLEGNPAPDAVLPVVLVVRRSSGPAPDSPAPEGPDADVPPAATP